MLLVFAWHLYPVPDGDSIFFLPAIKAYASTGVVDNKLVDLSFSTDPDGLGRFLFYTPGYPVIMGSAMALFGASSYQLALLFLSLVRAASTFLLAKSLVVILRKYSLQGNAFYVLPASAIVISSGLFLFASDGRPEILSMLFVSASVLAAISINTTPGKHIFLVLCIALLFPVSIANGIIACSFYLLYLFIDVKSLKIRAALVLIAVVTGLLFIVLSYLAAGLPLSDGLKGLSIHSKLAVGRSDSGLELTLSYWKSWIAFGILAIAYLVMTLLSRPLIRSSSLAIVDRLWLGSSILILCSCIYFFGFRAAPIHYNLYAFLPLYQFLSFRFFVVFSARSSRILRYSIQGTLAASLLLCLADPLRSAVLLPYYLASGSTYSQAMSNFLALDIGECALMHTGGLAVLDESQSGSQFQVDDSSRAIISNRIKFLDRDPTCIAAIVQEVNNNSRLPVEMEKIADYSDNSSWTPRLRALRLLNSPKGYSFYAYRQELSVK
jgi:hypothetical protein